MTASMLWLFAGLAGIGFVELFMRLPILPKFVEIKAVTTKIHRVIRSVSISDHWKEKVLLRYALRLFKLTIMLAIYLLVTFAPFFLIYGVSIVIGVPFMAFSISLVGILFITFISVCYANLRLRFVTQ